MVNAPAVTGRKRQIGSLRKAISLKPYGTELLTPGAAHWTFVARTIVTLMASAEALSWGYLGALFIKGWQRYLSGLIAGAFILLVIWGIDVSLMTLDRSRGLYERALYQREAENRIWEKTKEYLGFIARWVIVISSLTITAPFLAQIIFNVDIGEQIEAEGAKRIQESRGAIDTRHSQRITQLGAAITGAQTRLEQETAGRLREGSGIYGEGPVARSIRSGLIRDSVDLANAREGRELELGAFDRAVARQDQDTLRDRWGLLLPENSVIERGKVLAQIVQVPTYLRTELAIRAFLAFLFIALFILKLFEPRSVKIYLSETLQNEWDRFKAGAFDAWLSLEEKSDAKPSAMTPFRFEDIMLNVYPAVRAEDITRRKSTHVQVEAQDAEGSLADVRKEMAREIETSRARERQLDTLISTVRSQAAGIEVEMAEAAATIAGLREALQRIEQEERSASPSSDDEASKIKLEIVK